ncbi:MAG TPA: DoxX family protein [Pseudolabrys sp.]|jgi:putative oxidoreductase|nr:DoxX family protein [Pseudolabrys sp.]
MPVNTDPRLDRLAPYALSLLRIVAGLLFLEHGLAKLAGFPTAASMPTAFTLHWYAGVLEVVGGLMLIGGLYTRLAAFVLSGEMAFAYFLSHAPRGFYPILNHGEGAILFCFIFLYLFFAGGGPISLDAAIRGAPQPALRPAE